MHALAYMRLLHLQFTCAASNDCRTSGCVCPSGTPFCSAQGACLATRAVPTVGLGLGWGWGDGRQTLARGQRQTR